MVDPHTFIIAKLFGLLWFLGGTYSLWECLNYWFMREKGSAVIIALLACLCFVVGITVW